MPKPFKWQGELHLRSGSQIDICKVQISNVSLVDGLSFATVCQGLQAIEATPMYDFTDIEESLIPVCQLPSQTAQLSCEGEGDDDTTLFSLTAKYMEEFQKANHIPQCCSCVKLTSQTLTFRFSSSQS